MRAHRLLALVLAGYALAAAMLGLPARGASLFKPLPVAKATPAPANLVDAFAVEIDRDAVAAASAGSTLEAALPDGTQAKLRLERVDRHLNGDVSWIGRVDDPIRGDLWTTGTVGTNGAHVRIDTPTRVWAITPSQSGHEWLFDQGATQATLPPGDENDFIPTPGPSVPRAKAACPDVTSMPSPTVTIDLLAILAPDFIALWGGDAAAQTRLNGRVNEANAYHLASNSAITYRVVAIMRLPWGPATAMDNYTVLAAMTNGDAPFTNAKALRNFYGADQVAFFRGSCKADGTCASGVGYVPGDGNGALRSYDGDLYMWAVIGDWTQGLTTNLPHELGHLLGNKHDRVTVAETLAAGAYVDIGSVDAYASGHYACGPEAPSCQADPFKQAGKGFGTIMSYFNPKSYKFSSPNVTCQSNVAGAIAAPCGAADLQDNVRAMNCMRQQVSSLRDAWAYSCADLKADSDHDGIPDCLEAGSGKVNGTRDNDIFTDPLLFAAQQYRDFLSREADPDGLNYWIGQVSSAAQSRGQVIESFFNSPEFQGVIAPVARLYFAYFLRVPDYAGLNFWIDYFRAGHSLDEISNFFAQSPEFTTAYGSLDNSQFVTLVYNNVLSRAPDAPGLAFWKGQLDGGTMSRGQVMLGFSESAEYRTAINSEVYVTMMYMGTLRRGPEAGGFTFWVGYLDSGKPGLALIDGFLASAEYRARFLP